MFSNLKKIQRERKRQQRLLVESGILFVTTVEVLCQTHGFTFHLTTHKPQQKFTCHRCGKETFEIFLGTGKGNINITYTGADNAPRHLEKVDPTELHRRLALAQINAESGTFILVSQEKP